MKTIDVDKKTGTGEVYYVSSLRDAFDESNLGLLSEFLESNKDLIRSFSVGNVNLTRRIYSNDKACIQFIYDLGILLEKKCSEFYESIVGLESRSNEELQGDLKSLWSVYSIDLDNFLIAIQENFNDFPVVMRSFENVIGMMKRNSEDQIKILIRSIYDCEKIIGNSVNSTKADIQSVLL